jgi:transposase
VWSQGSEEKQEHDMSEQDRLAFWTKALNLPGFQVVHERRDTPSDPVRFTVVPTQEVAACPHCSHACSTVHRRHDSKSIIDLPIGPQAVELIVRTPQYECDRCGLFFTPSYSAIAPGAHATERFLEQAARLIRFSDIANVAEFFGVPENTLTRWYYDYVERHLQPTAELKPIRCLGIDELSLKKSTGSS